MGMHKAFSGERGKWRYLSKARDALAGSHLYNDSFTRSHYAVSGAEVVKERQAIAAPLNVDDFHAYDVPEVSSFSPLKRVVKGHCSRRPWRESRHTTLEKVKCKCTREEEEGHHYPADLASGLTPCP